MFFHFSSVAFALDDVTSPLKLPTFGELAVKSLVALVIVGGLIFLFAWYIRGYVLKSSVSEFIKVVDRVYIDNRRFLCLVKVSDKYFLLGVGDGGINLIAELEKVSSVGGEEVVLKSSFRKHLERFLGKKE
ncbi:MAG: flagellar biosynthetic protein FliO [Synergistetes bacterium]|nr:flagellar biosynthetic protein FliO [Synergistota bacterium]MDW8193043.1 flagellar biosynthetic protein FliO [Synergistota bacterium]